MQYLKTASNQSWIMPGKIKYMCFNKENCRIKQKYYIQLVYSSLLILAVVSFSGSLCYTTRLEKKISAVKKSEITFSAMPQTYVALI